jgi:hypothetical protein
MAVILNQDDALIMPGWLVSVICFANSSLFTILVGFTETGVFAAIFDAIVIDQVFNRARATQTPRGLPDRLKEPTCCHSYGIACRFSPSSAPWS